MFLIRLSCLSLLAAQVGAFSVFRPSTRASNSALNANILDTAKSAGTFKTLLAAVEATGLTNVLNGPGPFTLFAPNDEAFSKLPAGKLDSLLKDTKTLSDILLFHVHGGKLYPTRTGRTFNTLLIGEDTFPKQGTVKVTVRLLNCSHHAEKNHI
jgi:uncharacterized surface protein with fasciclin (FAS1) repeats